MFKLKYLLYVLLGLSVIVSIYCFAVSGGMTREHYTHNSTEWKYVVLDGFLGWSYLLCAAAALLAIVLPIINIVQNPKNLKKIGINVGAILLVIAIAFAFSSSAPLPIELKDIPPPSPFTLRLTSTGLIVAYILLAGALLTIIGSAVMNTIRNR